MKKRLFGMIAALLALTLTLPAWAYAADDAQTSEILISPTFGQTEARSMLDMINAFRTGDEAYYWNASNTGKVSSKGEELVYSYALEEIAMQRAAEIALSYSHTRPDNTICSSAVASDGTRSWAENIAAGDGMATTADEVFHLWREDNDDYSGQGHRRNMLNPNYKAIGIGHVTLNGIHYWAQEFSYKTDNTLETTAVDNARDVTIKVSPTQIQSVGELAVSQSEIMLQVGESAALPTVSVAITLSEAWPDDDATTVEATAIWTSGDASVCTVDGQTATGAATGAAVLTGAALGKTVAVSVTVSGAGGEPTPTPAYAISAAVPNQGAGTLSVTLSNPGAATVAAACFDKDGRFLSVDLQSVEANTGTVTLALSPDAKTARVTLLDSACRPLCACFETPIG